MSVRIGMVVAAAAALAALLGGAGPAAATQGSVPQEVAEYATAPDGLIRALDDFFGPGADGTGIDFDGSTQIGAVGRVFWFSPGWLAGGGDGTAVVLANEWAVPVSVGGTPVGVAVIWINSGTVTPQLADFLPDPALAEALAAVADEAFVVREEARGAWFALVEPTLTVLAGGTSGVSGETTLAQYRSTVAVPDEAPAADEGPSLGTALSVGTIVALALVVVLVLLVPLARRRAAAEPADED